MSSPQKISQLTTAGPLTGAELVPVVQNGGTLQTTVSVLAAFVNVSLSPVVSALQTQIDQVSALTSVNAASITSTNNVVSTLEVRVSAVSAAITSINAVVSTKVNRVGDYMDGVQYIEFDTSTIIPISVGRVSWNVEYGTLDVGLAGGNSSVLVGQREVMYVYNDTTATLTKGKVVEVTGAQGQRLTVKLAQADNDANSTTVLGIMLETVSANNSGYVATNGIVRNVNTGAFTDGQIVYLSPVSAGELTAIKPVAPQHLVMIGYVVKGNSVGAGSIYVKTQNGYELGELHDVKTSSSASISNNEILAYNTSAGVWTNSTAFIEAQASISALQIQLDAVSAVVSSNAASITSINNAVSALDIRLTDVSASVSALNVQMIQVLASISAINSALAAIDASAIAALEVRVSSISTESAANTAAITSINNVVSVLEIRVSAVSAQASSTQSQVNAVSALVSALDVRVAAVSASVSALQVQVDNVSAALTSTNNVVSVLEIRVSAASATGATNSASITSINAVLTSILAILNSNYRVLE